MMKFGILVLSILLCSIASGQGGPPSGYNVVVPDPPGVLDHMQFGDYVDMVLDSNGDPALTYIFYNPLGTGDLASSALYFVRWNRDRGAWSIPVRIAVIGDTTVPPPQYVSSLAYDASANTFAVAYLVQGSGGIDFSYSADGGQTWSTQSVIKDSRAHLAGPSLALGGGRVYLAFVHEFDGVRLLTGTPAALVTSWVSQIVPNTNGSEKSPISLKLDNAGKPGLAFWTAPLSGSNVLDFWRPEYPAAVQAGTTSGVRNDAIGVALAFFGTNPRLAVSANLDAGGILNTAWTTQSNDGGRTWNRFAYVTPAPGQIDGEHISLAVDSQGHGAIGLERQPDTGPGLCHDPVVARSLDFENWTSCTISGPVNPNVSSNHPQVAFDRADRLYLGFQNSENEDIPPGVILWHEPAANPDGPRISSGGVVNAASYMAPVAPGSLVTAFGTNFLKGDPVAAPATPFPAVLGGVSVAVNGRAAPLVYVTATQINFQLPYDTAPGTATVAATVNGITSNTAQVTVAPAAPGIFIYGANLGVIQNQDFSLNSPDRPASAGTFVTIYATGGGQVDYDVPAGTAAPAMPLSRVLQPVNVTIGNLPATVVFSGLAPGFAGLMQVNARVPAMPAGSYPVRISVGDATSNTPMIAVE